MQCGQRPARYWGNTILGSVVLRVTPWCGPCFEADTAVEDPTDGGARDKAELTPAEVEEGLLALGPIDWSVLRPFLASADAEVTAPLAAELAFIADAVRRIAAHHRQPLPADVAAFVARHGGPSSPAT